VDRQPGGTDSPTVAATKQAALRFGWRGRGRGPHPDGEWRQALEAPGVVATSDKAGVPSYQRSNHQLSIPFFFSVSHPIPTPPSPPLT